MSGYDENGNYIENETSAITNLRDVDKAKAKRIKELEAELATATTSLNDYATKARAGSLTELLKAKGVDPGVSKFLADVEQISFSARRARQVGQEVLYVTERAVFRMNENGLELTEVAPGIDVEREVLALMNFRPAIHELKTMPAHVFAPGRGAPEKH